MNQGKTNRAYEKKWKEFRDECIQMMIDAHTAATQMNVFNYEWEEDSISAHLIHDHLRKLPGKATWSINFGPKIITQSIADGSTSAKKAREPDIKFERQYSLRSPSRFEFHIEAKNLSENDWKKQDGTVVSANYYQKRYISTGIANICAGHYNDSCLAAYVVQGDSLKIVGQLNGRLQNANRSDEQLSYIKAPGLSQLFRSSHTTTNQARFDLVHIFLKIP